MPEILKIPATQKSDTSYIIIDTPYKTYNRTRMLEPARRISKISEYYFSRKLKEVARMNAEGKDIISLAIGSPDLPPSKATIDTLCSEVQKENAHGYVPTKGLKELREGMSRFYARHFGVNLDAETEIQPLIGSKEGILYVTLAFANQGDTVLIPDPGYPTYTAVNNLMEVNVVKYPLLENNRWQPDFDFLEALDYTNVKIIWTNYPNMPTGARAELETFERLLDLARRKNVLVVNDNPYSFILNKERLSILQLPGAKDFCLEFNSMSKSHNMPGWRVGMIAGKAEYINWLLRAKSNIDNGTFRPMQLAAAAALENDDAWHEENNYTLYARRRRKAEEIMDLLQCKYDTDSVGMFLWGRIPDEYQDCEELTERILHEARVFVTPGFIFGECGRRYIRISLCANEEKFDEAIKRIREYLGK